MKEDDWRLSATPAALRKEAFRGISLYKIPFSPVSEQKDHEHCVFCWDKFYCQEGFLLEGYCTAPQNEEGADWICPECYRDFQEMFCWNLVNIE